MGEKAEQTKQRIIECAKKEFLSKGFREASIRDIAANAKVTTGAIYRYYESKDKLFEQLVAPTVDTFMSEFTSETERFHELLDNGQMKQIMTEMMVGNLDAVVSFIYKNFDVFDLLIRCADGSAYESFFTDLMVEDAAETEIFIRELHRGRSVQPNIAPQHLILMTRMTYRAVLDIVVERMPQAEAEQYMEVLTAFTLAGWNEILGLNYL